MARLVYNTFNEVPAPDNLKVIHKDKNFLNCRFDNLRLNKIHGLPRTEKQIEVFENNAYAIVKWYIIQVKGFHPNARYWGGVTTDDLIQDCIFKIWQLLPLYDVNKPFTTFCTAMIRYNHICDKYQFLNSDKDAEVKEYLESLL